MEKATHIRVFAIWLTKFSRVSYRNQKNINMKTFERGHRALTLKIETIPANDRRVAFLLRISYVAVTDLTIVLLKKVSPLSPPSFVDNMGITLFSLQRFRCLWQPTSMTNSPINKYMLFLLCA